MALGRDAVWLALIVAAFYFGFGWLVILLAALPAVVFALSPIGVGISALGRRLTSRSKVSASCSGTRRKSRR
jgi:hypothetical protein